MGATEKTSASLRAKRSNPQRRDPWIASSLALLAMTDRLLLSPSEPFPCHMWTAPLGKRFFVGAVKLVAGFGHMSGLLARRVCPLALMKFDCEGS